MPVIDLSLDSPRIKAYFNGSNSYVPTSELLYVHTHPLISPNFLSDLEAVILKAAVEIQRRNITGAPIDKITELTRSIGKALPSLTQDNAASLLGLLREVYVKCNQLADTGTSGKKSPRKP